MFMNLLPKESVGSIFRVLLVVGCFTPSIAKAGFDWTPPPSAPSAQHTAPVAPDATPAGPLTPEPDALPVPVGNVESAPVEKNEPLAVTNKPTPVAAPTPAPVAEKIDEQPASPVAEDLPTPTPTPVAAPAPTRSAKPIPVPTPVSTPAPVSASIDVIEGFGKDIPLVIALRDIVPAKYAYAFSPREIAGTKISWRGGKVWQDVLKDALAPHGLDVSVSDNQVVIFAKPDSTAPAPSPKPAPSKKVASVPEPIMSVPAPSETLVANRPANAPDANQEPLPLVSSQDAQDQEKIAAGNSSTPSAAPAAEKPPVITALDMNATRKWQARPGTTLRETLEKWTKDSNVELNWSTPYDYPINNAFYFEGQFPQAVDSLLSSYGGESPSPKGRLYPNLPEGPSVLMIN